MPAIKKALILFVKAPKPGYVKTRLQPDLSPEQAGRLYLAFILDTLNATASLKGVTRILSCEPLRKDPFFRRLSERYGLRLIRQAGKDLGRRMRNAIIEAYGMGFHRVVIIGTDSPTLPVTYLRKAFKQLRKHSLVLGPSTDGGYYLMGCSGPVPPIFDGIAWGTGQVLTQTLERIALKNLDAHLLSFWYDIDTVQDLRFLSRHLGYLKQQTGKATAPETSRVLETLKFPCALR